jgi:hypothetical protein
VPAVLGAGRVGEVSMKRRTVPCDALDLQESASGHLRLDFSREVEWEEFPRIVARLMKLCRGTVIERADAGDIRVWGISVEGVGLNAAWEEQEWQDQGSLVSLASTDSTGDHLLADLYSTLAQKKRPKARRC